MSILSKAYFHNEEAAYEFVEARLWPNGATCPRCKGTERVSKMGGESTRIGTYKCYACRKPFTVKVGTIFEDSHVKMNLWLQAIYLIASSKKGISANQLHRTLGVTLKTAWFMGHRIREAARTDNKDLFGQGGGFVEVDETFIGNIKKKARAGYGHKNKVLTLIDRSNKVARSLVIDDLKVTTIGPIVKENLSREAKLMTDEAVHYVTVGRSFADHRTVLHSTGEYVFAFDKNIHTNTVEGFFSIFKRGMKGVYQQCSSNHLNRYLAEFDFRYNNRIANGVDDQHRADSLLAGVVGKRLTYQGTTA
jgi:transposase-like protein